MTIRQRRQHEVPTLNTSSLPDLIFTVLFFFMIVTHMRKVTLKVEYALPQGTELTRCHACLYWTRGEGSICHTGQRQVGVGSGCCRLCGHGETSHGSR